MPLSGPPVVGSIVAPEVGVAVDVDIAVDVDMDVASVSACVPVVVSLEPPCPPHPKPTTTSAETKRWKTCTRPCATILRMISPSRAKTPKCCDFAPMINKSAWL